MAASLAADARPVDSSKHKPDSTVDIAASDPDPPLLASAY